LIPLSGALFFVTQRRLATLFPRIAIEAMDTLKGLALIACFIGILARAARERLKIAGDAIRKAAVK
jgi:hypothetical protein